jgi:hypothetical protein
MLMQSAPNPIFALEPGALVEVKYATGDAGSRTDSYRWIPGVVISRDDETWPLVRLSDEQVTEIRPYMTWRLVQAAVRRQAA